MARNKDFRPIVKELRAQGWQVERTSQGHYRARPPDPSKPIVHFSESPDWRAIKNTLSNLVASGFQWPGEGRTEREADAQLEALVPEIESGVEAAAPEAPGDPDKSDMDRLFAALKEAKSSAEIARELRRLAVQEVKRAEARLRQAISDSEAADEALRQAKANFDLAFDSAAA